MICVCVCNDELHGTTGGFIGKLVESGVTFIMRFWDGEGGYMQESGYLLRSGESDQRSDGSNREGQEALGRSESVKEGQKVVRKCVDNLRVVKNWLSG